VLNTTTEESDEVAAADVDSEAASAAPAVKKRRIDVCDFEDDDIIPAEPDEVTAYLKTRFDGLNRDILSWWEERADQFLKLARLFRQVFTVPTSGAASERSFSAAGCAVSERTD